MNSSDLSTIQSVQQIQPMTQEEKKMQERIKLCKHRGEMMKAKLGDYPHDKLEEDIIKCISQSVALEVSVGQNIPLIPLMGNTNWLCIDLNEAWKYRLAGSKQLQKMSPELLLSLTLNSAMKKLDFLTVEEFEKWAISNARLAVQLQNIHVRSLDLFNIAASLPKDELAESKMEERIRICLQEGEVIVGAFLRVRARLGDLSDASFEQKILSFIQRLQKIAIHNRRLKPLHSFMENILSFCIDLGKAIRYHQSAARNEQQEMSPSQVLSIYLSSALRGLSFLTDKEFKNWAIFNARMAAWMRDTHMGDCLDSSIDSSKPVVSVQVDEEPESEKRENPPAEKKEKPSAQEEKEDPTCEKKESPPKQEE